MEDNSKADRILEAISDIKIVLERHSVLHEKNTEDLAEHIKRTTLLEQAHSLTKLDIENIKTANKTVYKVLTVICALIVGIAGLLKTLSLI